MRPVRKIVTIKLAVLSLLLSCGELTEVDLGSEEIILVAPGDGASSPVQSLVFAWEPVLGASEYEVTVASPNFKTVETLVAKELTDESSVLIVLPEGSYEWRVRAFNSVYSVNSVSRSVTIHVDTAAPFANQRVRLVRPEKGAMLRDSQVQLLWTGLQLADAYDVQVASPQFGNTSFIISDSTITSDVFTISPIVEREYKWRVRPVRLGEPGAWAENGFTIDRTPPAVPRSVEPLDEDIVDYPAVLRWTEEDGAVAYELEIHADSLTGREVANELMVQANFELRDSLSDTYFWRVRSIDAAENKSVLSSWSSYFLADP